MTTADEAAAGPAWPRPAVTVWQRRGLGLLLVVWWVILVGPSLLPGGTSNVPFVYYLLIIKSLLLAIGTATLVWSISRRWWLSALSVVLAAGAGAVLFNWSIYAPRTWFDTHRSLYEAARHEVRPTGDYHGSELPWRYRGLSGDGLVAGTPDRMFFPMWKGIPDDAGGYWYTPGDSPAGEDMYGMPCQDPTDLGGGWWMCGM